MNQYGSIPPEAMQAIMNTGDNDPEAVLLKQRQARADALRRASMQRVSPGQMAGRVFIPNLGGLATQGAQMYKADQMQSQLDQDTGRVMGRTNDARNDYANRLIQALRRQQQQQQPIGMDSYDPEDRFGGY